MRDYVNLFRDGRVPVTVTYLFGGGNGHATDYGEKCARLYSEKINLSFRVFDAAEVDRDPSEYRKFIRSAKESNLLLMNFHGDISGFKKFDGVKKSIIEASINTFVNCFFEESMAATRFLFLSGDEAYQRIKSYMHLGGPNNREFLVKYLCKLFGDVDVHVPEPEIQRAQGVYHPDYPLHITLEAYLDTLDPSKPTIGVMIPQGAWVNGQLEPQNLLIRRIEARGANTLPVFYTPTPSDISKSIGGRGIAEQYFTRNGSRMVDCIVMAAFGFSMLALSCPTDGSDAVRENFLQKLNVPVLASLPMFRPQAVWEKDGIGMEGGELAVSVAMPECDGQLITVPFCFRETDESGREYNSYRENRIDRIAGMAVGWGRVCKVPVKDRKVSILFNGGSLSNAPLGCAGGLDSFASVLNLVKAMVKEGYVLDRMPESGENILDEMLSAITNNLEWNSDEDIRKRAADFVTTDRYGEWFKCLRDGPAKWICRNWGDPPGEIMSLDGKFIIPGVMNGNVYFGLEPERGKHAKAEELIHDPDLSTPHSYLAYYRWIAQTLKSDIHIHIGTHGSAEWLPGKGCGLSDECFPDIMMEDVPNLYAYVIDDPSEGIVAKRRKKSVLVDYLMPSLTRADTYDDLSTLEGHVQEYLYCKQTMQRNKMASVGDTVYDLIAKISMWKELGLDEGAPADEVLSKCEMIFDYLADLKDGLITDGLHIMGKVPEGRHMEEMVYCLTRLKNGRIPSLRWAISNKLGFDLDALLDHASSIDPYTGELNGTLVDRIDKEMQTFISEMHNLEFEIQKCRDLALSKYGNDSNIVAVTDYICGTIHPNICRIEEEITNMVNGMSGGYVPPGPSGSPTRGNAHLLPTGKNFYSLDPETVPGPESWRVGRLMADDMIRDYISREGKYPENVGIVVWSIDTMKTGGDDIAYILSLLGIRPVWGSVGGKITGLEVMTREELQRPRIDVAVRISSLFRDTFPNLFQLIDEAVELASDVEESDEDNYVRKHLKEDIAEMMKEGLSHKEAREKAMIRVFGEPPGTHGAGVNILVESSKWNSVDDLAQIYITCGCSAYGRKWRGEKQPELFRKRLLELDVAVKNQVDREFDLIDVDDGYSYLGGMNAVVRSAGKEKPVNYIGDSSDPDRIKTRSLENEVAYMMRTRILNPKWIEGLKDHGFVGANLISDNVNHAFGWDATSDVIEKWMYDSMAEHFLFNEDNRKWIEENNPYAIKDLLEDLLEAIERGMWDADIDMKRALEELYLDAEGRLEEIAADRNSRRK